MIHICLATTDFETIKFITSSSLQVILAGSAALLTWHLARDKSIREHADLKLKLYDKRYDAYLAFDEFITHCIVQDIPTGQAIQEFGKRTERIDFLFGQEIVRYKREVMANALAIFGIETKSPCTMPP